MGLEIISKLFKKMPKDSVYDCLYKDFMNTKPGTSDRKMVLYLIANSDNPTLGYDILRHHNDYGKNLCDEEDKETLFNVMLDDAYISENYFLGSYTSLEETQRILDRHKIVFLNHYPIKYINSNWGKCFTKSISQDLVNMIIEKEDYKLAKKLIEYDYEYLKCWHFTETMYEKLNSLLVAGKLAEKF